MHRSLIYEGIKCCGLELASALHVEELTAEIKYERQTLRTTESFAARLMYQRENGPRMDENDAGDLNERRIICWESFRELYTLKQVTERQAATLTLFGN